MDQEANGLWVRSGQIWDQNHTGLLVLCMWVRDKGKKQGLRTAVLCLSVPICTGWDHVPCHAENAKNS